MERHRRRSTRIPRPPIIAPLQEMNFARKRKAGSPLKPINEPEKAETAGSGRRGAAVSNTATPAQATPAPSAPAVEESWESISEAREWTPEDCLNHKVAVKKKEKDQVLRETFMQHIRALRALGRHLLASKNRFEEDCEVQKQKLATAEQQEVQMRQEHQQAVSALEKTIADHQDANAELKGLAAGQQSCISQLEAARDTMQATLATNAAQRDDLLDQQAKATQQIADLQQQVATQVELHQHAQKYNAQLQEYNGKLQDDLRKSAEQVQQLQAEKAGWSEETSANRGTIRTLEQQLEAARGSAEAADTARRGVAGDADRLRVELVSTTTNRDAAVEEGARLRSELSRFKEATGKSVELLEREKADKAHLESTNQAQAEVNSGLQQQLARAKAEAAGAVEAARVGAEATEAAQARIAQLESALVAADARVRECETIRRRLHNTILELKGNIRVFCRVRPLADGQPAVESLDGQPIMQFPSTGDQLGRGIELQVPASGSDKTAKHAFAFDKVFEPASTQEEVFEEVSQLVQSALDGYKVCIFAYGQTGSGKTHTMMGPQYCHEQRGVIPRAVEQLYQATHDLEADGWNFEMKASMLEIYNEECKDLLGKGGATPSAGRQQPIRHDERGVTTVAGVETFDVRVQERLQALMGRAAQKRSTMATASNEHSSRSHMVFMLTIVGHRPSTGQSVHGVLNLIDLAGSERLSKSLATGDRLKETQAINKSLSALGDVISALGAKADHIPYRNSRLTYLLQPCLGGDAKTLMFVNLAPTGDAAPESLCSLRFAAKVNATDIGTARRLGAAIPK
ncbi:hypothetical protein WJX73_009377 [Symbiochloris irregularis]|uniref:Kinesin-like protein n=1 Tax=Symbiochloris irregularis TaxID=706552 RepID=A0AAW1Q018_9CHLO